MTPATGPVSFPRRIFEGFLVFAVFAAVTAAFFYPTFGRFFSALIGPPEDNTFFLWSLWYGSRAIAEPALDFFHSKLIYYPEGMGLWYSNYFYVGVAAASALKPLLGIVASYNLITLLSFPLSGLLAYLLILYLTQDRFVSICGGFLYAFNPFHYAHALHHPSVASIQFIPLFVWFLIRAHRSGGWKNRFGAAACLALSAYCDWNYLIYGGLMMTAAFGWTTLKDRRIMTRKGWLNLIVIGGGAVALTAPVLVPMIAIGLKHPQMQTLPGHNIFVADGLGFFVPHAYHALAGVGWIRSINDAMTGTPWEQPGYLGWAALAVVVAAFKGWRLMLPYFLAFMLCAVLALGVELHIAGRLTGVRLPYAVFETLPFLKHARNPSRIMAFGYLFWSILVALALKQCFRAPSRGLRRRVAMVLVAGIGFMDFYSVCADVTPVQLPPVYGPILNDPEYRERNFAIMNIPWDKGRYMMEQTIHGLPDLQGYLGRKMSASLISQLPFENLPLQKEVLKRNRVKYVLIRKKRMEWDPLDPEELRIYSGLTQLTRLYARVYSKVYEDDNDALYRVYP